MKPVTLDDTISFYEGTIVANRKRVYMARNDSPSERERHERALARDQLILGALKCAKAAGYSGEN